MLSVLNFAKFCSQSMLALHEGFCPGLVWSGLLGNPSTNCPRASPETQRGAYVERHFEIH